MLAVRVRVCVHAVLVCAGLCGLLGEPDTHHPGYPGGNQSSVCQGERKQQYGQAKVRELLVGNKTMDLCQLPVVKLTKRGLGCYRRTWCIPSADLSTR